MKKLKVILTTLLILIMLLSVTLSYATEVQEITVEKFGNLKYICIGVGVVLILLILFISYKSDMSQGEEEIDEDENETFEDETDYDDIEIEDESITKVEEEQSLYNVLEDNGYTEELVDQANYDSSTKVTEYLSNEEFEYEQPIEDDFTGFELDEIFEDKISEINNQDNYYVEENNENLEYNDNDSSLDNDFIIQMNKNLALENFIDIDEEKIDEVKEPAKKVATKKETTKTAKKEPTKKATTKKETTKTAKKEPTKKAATKKETTKTAKKEPTKKAATKKETTKTAKKEPTKKVATKKETTKVTKKETAKKVTTKKNTKNK